MGINTGNIQIQSVSAGSTPVTEVYVGSRRVFPIEVDTPPEARDVAISGDPYVGSRLDCTYTYFDAEGDPEEGTTFQWYRRLPAEPDPTPIAGATVDNYTIMGDDLGYIISCGVTPANANAVGTEVMSNETVEITEPAVGGMDFTINVANDGDSFLLPIVSGLNYDFTIDWGDGTQDTITDFNDTAKNHVYATAGTYSPHIEGLMEGWSFREVADSTLMVTSVDAFSLQGMQYLEGAFQNSANLLYFDGTGLDVSAIDNLEWFFNEANLLETAVGFETWDVSNCNRFHAMFRSTSIRELSLAGWQTAIDTLFTHVFSGSDFLETLDLTGFSSVNIIDFNSAFYQTGQDSPSGMINAIGLDEFNMSNCANFTGFACCSTFPIELYNAILNINTGWISRGMLDGLGADLIFGDSQYSLSDQEAVDGRAAIEAQNWVISDGGGV